MPAWLWIGAAVTTAVFIAGIVFVIRSGGHGREDPLDEAVERHRRKANLTG